MPVLAGRLSKDKPAISINLTLGLGWPCTNFGALLAQPQKNNDVQCLPSLPLPVSAGRLS